MRATIEVIVASLWLGAAIFFSTAVAQAAFTVLPTRTLSGLFVGRTLPVIFDAGIIAGLIVLVLQWGATPMERSGWRIGSGILVVVACAVAQFVVGRRIERVRAAIPGAITDAGSTRSVRS